MMIPLTHFWDSNNVTIAIMQLEALPNRKT